MPGSYQLGDEPIPGFRLIEFLGRGGFGEVWMASAPGGTRIALKIINLQRQKGLREFRAIRLVKRIRHPHLVPIHSFWLKDEAGRLLEDSQGVDSASGLLEDAKFSTRPCELLIAMGLCDANLFDRLEYYQRQGDKGIPPGELLGYMEDAARAIDYLNSPQHDLGQGIVAIQHCDIKPQNLLCVGGSVQVGDFGLARTLGEIRASAAAGSPAYGAPEVIRGQPSHATDQYSLAISYVELRTGELPFSQESCVAVIEAHLQGNLDLSRLPPAEREVIARATALHPDERFPTVSEMVRELRHAVTTGEVRTWSNLEARPAAEPKGLVEGSEIVPGYRLSRLLVRDAVDSVWEASAPGGKPVAMLFRDLRHARGSLDLQALSIAQRLEHENLTELHAFWLLDEHAEIVPDALRLMPSAPAPAQLVIAGKLAKQTLQDQLDAAQVKGLGGIPLDELMSAMQQLAEGLDFLNTQRHRLGEQVYSIQHRQVRPGNALVYGKNVRLGNFSYAKTMQARCTTIPQAVRGLAHPYAAPEVFNGQLTIWSDQYSLAVMYVELRTGLLPLDPRASDVAQRKALREGRLDLTRLPLAEASVVSKATRMVPEERFPTCTAFYEALAAAASKSPQTLPQYGFDISVLDEATSGDDGPRTLTGSGIATLTGTVATTVMQELESILRTTAQFHESQLGTHSSLTETTPFSAEASDSDTISETKPNRDDSVQ